MKKHKHRQKGREEDQQQKIQQIRERPFMNCLLLLVVTKVIY